MSITSSPAQKQPVRRRRRWVRYSLLLLAMPIVGLVAGFLYLSWSIENDFQAAVAETDALDPRWRLEHIEADRKPVADADNSALQTIVVAKLMGRNSVSAHPNYENLFEGLPSQHQLNAMQMEIIREAFERMDEARVEARKLKDMPHGRFPIVYSPDFISTLLPNQQDARQSMDLLKHDAMYRVQNGDADGAMESCMALLNAGRSLGDEPLLISYLIRLAGDNMLVSSLERVLAQGFPKAELLKDMQDRIAQEREDARAHWINSMRGERAGHHVLAGAIAENKLSISALIGGPGGRTNWIDRLQEAYPVAFTRSYPDHLRHLNEGVAATKLPTKEQIDRVKELEQRIPQMGAFTRLLAPALSKITQAHVRSQANLVATETALACERFRIETKRWPETLDELVKHGLLADVPSDPLDDQPLRCLKLADGIVIYSVGFDKADNRGKIDRDRPHEAGIDLGVRLWDAPRRRQPPLPPKINRGVDLP